MVVIINNVYNLYNATGYPVSGRPDNLQMKPDFQPDTKKAVYPVQYYCIVSNIALDLY